MTWDASDFNGLAKIRIPPDLIWRPDIVLYNGSVGWRGRGRGRGGNWGGMAWEGKLGLGSSGVWWG